MAQEFDKLVDRTVRNLQLSQAAAQSLKGQVEGWSLIALLDSLDASVKALDGITEVVQLEGREVIFGADSNLSPSNLSRPEDYDGLRHTYRFYDQMLQLGHLTLGSVMKALRVGAVRRELVEAAAAQAYLHEPVRATITAGYGITKFAKFPKPLPAVFPESPS